MSAARFGSSSAMARILSGRSMIVLSGFVMRQLSCQRRKYELPDRE
jgi:hypothetical protein